VKTTSSLWLITLYLLGSPPTVGAQEATPSIAPRETFSILGGGGAWKYSDRETVAAGRLAVAYDYIPRSGIGLALEAGAAFTEDGTLLILTPAVKGRMTAGRNSAMFFRAGVSSIFREDDLLLGLTVGGGFDTNIRQDALSFEARVHLVDPSGGGSALLEALIAYQFRG